MNFIKTIISKILRKNDHRPVVLFDESAIKINTNVANILSPAKEKQEIITATMAFHFLLQATADVADDREKAIEAGLVAETMTNRQCIAYFYALFIFVGYEKKYSPLIAASLIKNYCAEEFFLEFTNYYVQICNSKDVAFQLSCFNNDDIESFMDIKGSADRMKSLGYKKHWIPPFKEPYKEEWLNSF